MDGDGVADAGEPGITNVTVTLTWYGPDGVLGTADDQVLTTTTDANGNYAFTGIPGGQYRVDVDQSTAPAGTSLTTGNDPTDLTLLAGETNNNVDFGFNGIGLIGQWVFLDINNNGVRDPGEGISGVTVTAVADIDGDGIDEVFVTVTGPDGSYEFPGLPVNDGVGGGITYLVTVDTASLPPGVLPSVDPDGTLDNATSVTLSPGSPTADDTDFGYRGPGSIGDTIFLDINGNNVADPGEGISGVTVTLTGDFDGDGIAETVSTVTDADGNYLFSGLVTDNGAGSGVAYTVAVVPSTLPLVTAWYVTAWYDPGWHAGSERNPESTRRLRRSGFDFVSWTATQLGCRTRANRGCDGDGPGDFDGRPETVSTVTGPVRQPAGERRGRRSLTRSGWIRYFQDGNSNGLPNAGEEIAGVTVTLTRGLRRLTEFPRRSAR
jgi:hypothetical protein